MSVRQSDGRGRGLWREGFKEKVSFELRVEKSRSDGKKIHWFVINEDN